MLNAAVDCTRSTEGHNSRQGKSIKTRNEKRRARCTGYCNGCIGQAREIGCGITWETQMSKTTEPDPLLGDNVFKMAAGIQQDKSW